jgi:hypothetical protein
MYCTDTSSSHSGSSNAAVLSLTKEVEKAKEKAEQQEVKLKQAAEFISYQEEQISTLTKDVEELNTQLESSSVKRWVLCTGCSYFFCFQATSLLLVLTHRLKLFENKLYVLPDNYIEGSLLAPSSLILIVFLPNVVNDVQNLYF